MAAGRTAVLHFELLRGCLSAAEAKQALASPDRKAPARWKKHEPRRCSATDADAQRARRAVIVECEPVRADDGESEGLSYDQRIVVGKVMVPIVVPLVRSFRLRLLSGRSGSVGATILAVHPKSLDLSERRLAIGAIVHEGCQTVTGQVETPLPGGSRRLSDPRRVRKEPVSYRPP